MRDGATSVARGRRAMRTIGRMGYPKWLAAFAVCGLGGLAMGADSPAVAQETPGYDPDDPAGVEYQLPLQRTRREATGRKPDGQQPNGRRPDGQQPNGRQGSASKSVPLFGAGANADAGKAGRTREGGSGREGSDPRGGTGASSRGGRDGAADGSTARDRGGAAGSAGAATPAKAAANSDGDDPLQLGLAGGILFVILGAALGIAVRLRTRAGRAEG